ncbi:MAG TPA: group III truncated hemoglobin [Pyrinomonadaceae bacterium]|nr:group III truncated hemoglobin [Pyrinomonadaceae bacterium]
MKHDIENRADLELLLTEFYKIATTDAEIGHHFAGLDLAAHLPIIVDFWEKILFGKQVYFGNPAFVHQRLNEKSPLELEHFRRWVEIFSRIVDKLFIGETAENAKLRAKMIAHSLHQRVQDKGFSGVQISR